jgi:hypothetical protein
MSFFEVYKKSVIKEFRNYKSLGDKSFAQLEADDFYKRSDEHSNNIATIIFHMYGNMLSRWTDFFTTDGEKNSRNRDTEFNEINFSKEDLLAKWEQGWKCLMDIIENLEEADLEKTIYIRKEPHHVIEAINRQIAHYSYHVGQIVYLAKEIKKDSFASLSIPKNKSQEFNQKMFGK